MPEILTTNFKTDTNRKFVADAKANDYYLFVSGIENVDPENSLKSKNEFLAKTLFGKKIDPDDVRYMIRYYPWQAGDTYVQYDDNVNLEGEKFYAVVGPTQNDTGDYRVYKCLFNNYGAKTIDPPPYNVANADQIYETADGYKWKFMYVIGLAQFNAYNTLGYIPITGTFDEDPTPTSGGSPVSDIFVENNESNLGYTYVFGNMVGSPLPAGSFGYDFQIVSNLNSTLSSAEGYYNGQSIYLTNPGGSNSFLYEIDDYVYDASTGSARITVVDKEPDNPAAGTPSLDGVASSASYVIYPRVEIIGDGTGCEAIPYINLQTNTIEKIQVLTAGTGYNTITARIIDPLFDFNPEENGDNIRAIIRPVLAPPDGHATNFLDELYCKHFLVYAYITGDDNQLIGATNTYNGVGVVRAPQFTGASPEVFDNRIAVNSLDANLLIVNTVITQVNSDGDTTFSGVIHEIDTLNDVFYIAEYVGPYENQPASDIALDLTRQFRNETGQIISINSPAASNVTTSEYIQRTGKVYYMEDFFPLERTALSREEFKLIFEF